MLLWVSVLLWNSWHIGVATTNGSQPVIVMGTLLGEGGGLEGFVDVG